MTREEMPVYDLPISVVAEYSSPPPSSGAKPKMAMTDQNYRTPEYHAFVRELIELHRPIIKSGVIMICPVCDRSWYLLDDATKNMVCSFWSRAIKMGLIINITD